jgi:Zn-dependent peptidase ImmA (M78 family)
MSENLAQFRSELRGWAAELSSSSVKLPVFVSSICKRLGVSVARRGSVPRYKAYLSINPVKGPSAIILLPDKEIGSFERFCVAHELAHYLLFKLYKAKPISQNEYWRHEKICDEFARHLLILDKHLARISHSLAFCRA